MEEILKYFTDLTDKQKQQFAALFDLYKDWNEKINVISRKDIDNLYLHHVLHSLAIARRYRSDRAPGFSTSAQEADSLAYRWRYCSRKRNSR